MLRAVHGGVGLPQKLFRRAISIGGKGDADARQRDDISAREPDRDRDCRPEPFGHVGRLASSGQVLREHDELIAAEPGHGVRRANRPAQPATDLDEQLVAVLVAERVVDELEAVEVEVEDPDGLSAPVEPRQGVAETVLEQDSVGQSG